MARAIACLILLLSLASCRRQPPTLEVSFWYWHTPFRLEPGDIARLREIGVKRLFVRAGTFTHEAGGGTHIIIPQQWAGPSPFKTVLVYNFDSGLVQHFGELDEGLLSNEASAEISKSSQYAISKGISVEGVQLDVDCPTRLLPKYARFLAGVRRLLTPRGWTLSATGLSSWLDNSGLNKVVQQVDYFAPQFYESDVARWSSEVKTVSDLGALESGLGKASALGKPFYAGIADYGHALLYDEKGRIAGMYRGLSVEDALRHPALRFEAATPLDRSGKPASSETYVGEDLVTLRAVRPGRNGRGLGYQIAYYIPSSRLVSEQMKVVRQNASDNCRGVILYRMPQQNDSFALPLGAAEEAIEGKPEIMEMRLRVSNHADPWRKIERDPNAKASNVTVSVTNVGNAPTNCSPNGVQVLVRLAGRGVEEVQPGDFDKALPCHSNSGRLTAAPLAEADSILLIRSRLGPGETAKSGSLHIRSAARPVATWRAQGPGGFREFSGGEKR